ncbi:MAG: hypothetical protein JNK15_25090 [Planctomycetes bacterium]|nr:hypothetical protein [Planctomycetota bacterium]
MDLTLLGENINAPATGKTVTGYWMPAGGNDGVGGCEVFYNSSASAFTVYMDTKSSDEIDADAGPIGSVAISSVTTTTPVTYKFDLANAKELVRYRVVSSKAGVVHLQFAQPLWQPN